MVAINRHLSGDMNTVIAPIKAATVVEMGDFLFVNVTNALLSTTSAKDDCAYPFKDMVPATVAATCAPGWLQYTFLGVAMESSPVSGVTDEITVATSGVFRYPLHPDWQTSGVTVGSLISAVSSTLTGGTSNQYVMTITAAPGSTCYLGRCMKTKSAATFVDFELMTAFGPCGVAKAISAI